MTNHIGNIVFYCNTFLHLEFARIDACNGISLVYTENTMAGFDVSLITQSNYACTTQDKLWRSTITTKLCSVALKQLWEKKLVWYRTFGLQNPKSFHYQIKTNNCVHGLIELQYIQLTPMTSDMPPMLEEPISKPIPLKYSPINNQINNIKIILFNIKF